MMNLESFFSSFFLKKTYLEVFWPFHFCWIPPVYSVPLLTVFYSRNPLSSTGNRKYFVSAYVSTGKAKLPRVFPKSTRGQSRDQEMRNFAKKVEVFFNFERFFWFKRRGSEHFKQQLEIIIWRNFRSFNGWALWDPFTLKIFLGTFNWNFQVFWDIFLSAGHFTKELV